MSKVVKKKSNAEINQRRQKNKRKKDIAFIVTVLVVVFIILISIFVGVFINSKANIIKNTEWKSVVAFDKKGKEVDLRDVYVNADRYDNYTGSIIFDEDNTFEFWMSIGDPGDGTHTGTYEYDWTKETISVVFDNGDKAVFNVHKKDNNIDYIEVPYGDYTINFKVK